MFDYFPGTHGFTEEVIYQYQPFLYEQQIPIFSGSQDNTVPIGYICLNAKNNKEEDIRYFDGECIILTKDGSSGQMTYINSGVFTINHHACVLKLKQSMKKIVHIKWFAFQYRTHLLQYTTSKSDNRVFSTDWFDRVSFEVPDYSIQERIQQKRDILLSTKNSLEDVLKNLINIDKHVIPFKNVNTFSEKFSSVFTISGGNSNLTEEFIYHNLPESEDEKVEILTASTQEDTAMGFVSINAKPNDKVLKVFNGPAIIVARNGYAGTMRFIKKGRFTTNDHAYVLKPKKEWVDKINLVWFIYEYQNLFWNITTSKSDNATFSKEYAERQVVQIPDIKEQNRIMDKINPLKNTIEKLQNIQSEITELLRYSIS